MLNDFLHVARFTLVSFVSTGRCDSKFEVRCCLSPFYGLVAQARNDNAMCMDIICGNIIYVDTA